MYITLWSLYYIFIKSRPCNYPIFWISISFGRTRLRMIAKHHDGKAVYHLGHGNQTDVLGEGSQRRAPNREDIAEEYPSHAREPGSLLR